MNVLILGGGKAISNFTNYKIIGSNATPPKHLESVSTPISNLLLIHQRINKSCLAATCNTSIDITL